MLEPRNSFKLAVIPHTMRTGNMWSSEGLMRRTQGHSSKDENVNCENRSENISEGVR